MDSFIRRLCIQPVEDMQAIDDDRALDLIVEMQVNVCDDAVLERNAHALARRYGKTDGAVLHIVTRDRQPEDILAELKKDTRIHL